MKRKIEASRQRLGLALLLFALVPACREKPPGTPRLQLVVEDVGGKLAQGGFLTVRGWGAESPSAAPIRKMEIYLDGTVRGDVRLRRHRHDIAAALGQDHLWSGFVALLSLRHAAPGAHRIDIFAESPSGERAGWTGGVFVRPFASAYVEPPWRLYAVLILRTLAFFLWLVVLGVGFVRWFARSSTALLAPGAGLALLAIGIETGALLRIRPLLPAAALTALSAILFLIPRGVRRAGAARPSSTTAATLGIALLFVLAAAVPLASHGKGAVLGTITDAAWECSAGDSIARYGWSPPPEIEGHLNRVPAEWRRVNFRGGSPYILALLGQAFDVRAHEVHSVLMLVVGALVICSVGALSARVLRLSIPGRWLAIGLAGSSSVLFGVLYSEHAAILIATALFLSFLFHLLTLVRSPRLRAVLPVAWTLAAAFTLYPEMMVLWGWAALASLPLAASGKRALRTAGRLVLAAILATLLNPVAFARSIRFAQDLASAPVLATPERRTVFGDIHYFPPLQVVLGIEPFRADAPVPSSWRIETLRGLAILLMAVCLPAGFVFLRRAQKKLFLYLFLPAALGLLANWYLRFPYGYSKLLQHAAPLWSLCLALLLVGFARSDHPRFPIRARRTAAFSTGLLVVFLSTWSVRDTLGRALRSVPTYDPAFQTLPSLVEKFGHDAVIVISDPSYPHREWIAYFLGENRVVHVPAGQPFPADPLGRRVFRLVDLREQSAPFTEQAVANAFFALVPAPG